MIRELLENIACGSSDENEICPDPIQLRHAIDMVMEGEIPQSQLAALLMGLRCRGERAEHLKEVVEVMMTKATPFPRVFPDGTTVLDTCGTGGDAHGMINVSTAAALLAAAYGIPVAKHGNRSVSSRSGSADVLEVLGIKLEVTPETCAAMLKDLNYCFLYAPKYHPAMRHAGPTRRELKFRTIFNLAGPLSNPAGATHQLVGVSESRLISPIVEALRLLGSKRALVVHGRNREDEISLTTVTEGMELRSDGSIHSFYVDPTALGLDVVEMAELVVEGPEHSAECVRRVLGGEESAMANVIALNFAGALYLTDKAGDMGTAVQMALDFQRSGAAAAHLDKLIERSNTP